MSMDKNAGNVFHFQSVFICGFFHGELFLSFHVEFYFLLAKRAV